MSASPDHVTLSVPTFEALRKHEAEIVRRINARRHGGRLLAIDPLRLLREVRVHLGPDAIAGWKLHAGAQIFDDTRNGAAYDAIAASAPHARPVFRVTALLRGEKS